MTNSEKNKLIKQVEHLSDTKISSLIEKDRCLVFVYDENAKADTDSLETTDKSTAFEKSTPAEICKQLKAKVYRQDEYCEWASMIIYNHLHHIPGIFLVNGPSGCGKTYLWEVLREKIDKVTIIDSSGLSQRGWEGVDIAEALSSLHGSDDIVVLDEFDKLIKPNYAAHGTNVSFGIQSNLLKVFDDGFLTSNDRDPFNTQDQEWRSTKDITFILCGSFAEKAEEKVRKPYNGSNIGFIPKEVGKTVREYSEPVNLKDAMEYGLLRELASRVVDIFSLNPLTADDYKDFVKSEPNGAIKQISDCYQKKILISNEYAAEIAKEAYDSELGLRKVINLIKARANDYLFNHFDKAESTGKIILLNNNK